MNSIETICSMIESKALEIPKLDTIEERHNKRLQRFLTVKDESYTTRTCNFCRGDTGPRGINGLGIREWECRDCGTVHDRDVNSALNILALGHERLAVGIPVLQVGEDVKETHNVQYSQCSGYHYNGDRDTPSYYLNGALWMFKELYCDIGCKHDWVGKSENQYYSKCGIGDE